MSKLNKRMIQEGSSSTIHKNFMDGNSWDITNPFLKLKLVAASSFFSEPKYYDNAGNYYNNILENDDYDHKDKFKYNEQYLGECLNFYSSDGKSVQNQIEAIIDECLDIDVEKTLQIAASLRNEDLIRTTPQVILARAAMHKNSKGTGLIRKYIDKICVRGDEPAAVLSYIFATYGKDAAIPNSIKRGLKDILESFDEYVISKYKMNDNFVKTLDVVNLVHANSEPINKLMNGKARQTKTWNSIVSGVDKKTMSKTEIWTKALATMPHMALLRNISNLMKNGVDENLYLDRLLNGVEGGKQLPFRYYSAYKKVCNNASPKVLDTLEKCIDKSFANCPHFTGRTMILSDNSGSARCTMTSEMGKTQIAEIGNLMAVMTGKMCDEAQIGIFGDRLEIYDLQKSEPVFPLVNKLSRINIGESTENGIWLFFDQAIKNKEFYNNIFVYSDMQAGHGGLYGIRSKDYSDYIYGDTSNYIDVPKLINKYRQTVNKNVMVYLIQTAGYDDILVPEYYDKTFILGGWSSNIPLFAAKMSKLFNN